MITNTFSAESSIIIYAVTSVVLCVVAYMVKGISRFDWHSEKMNEVVGSGVIRQVDINSGDPARNAAVAASNVTNSMSAANGASLFVLAYFLFGLFAGSVAIPAALGMMSTITSLNLLALMVAGMAWGLCLGRLTMSLTKLLFKLAVWGALVIAMLFVINFAFSFLNNGKDLFWNSTVEKVVSVKDSLYNYDRAPAGSWFFKYEMHRKRNLCALYKSISTKGDIEATRDWCY
ncbi:hypothetical protein [Rhodoferax sp.]|uniref:hypothetical protein n=1 Tax=Rhodoferax sp. TaxID=50421 RepID=UPI00273192E4|nr:hypothetical protein [Rhodoferax sp.]MDP2442488.1 hypothetical protein [Rhodoferax sp.]MDZ4209158.1 hypothetical protein [Rhodoferax sp.]